MTKKAHMLRRTTGIGVMCTRSRWLGPRDDDASPSVPVFHGSAIIIQMHRLTPEAACINLSPMD